MTGIVNGRVEVYKDGSVDVVPEPCPVEGRHPGEGQRCYVRTAIKSSA